jgi:hypothetical protein
LWVASGKPNIYDEWNPAIVEDSLSKMKVVSSSPSQNPTKTDTHAANFDDFADTFLEIDYKESRLDGTWRLLAFVSSEGIMFGFLGG